MKQRQAQAALQRLDRLADGRRRHADIGGGRAEAGALGDGEEFGQTIEGVRAGHDILITKLHLIAYK